MGSSDIVWMALIIAGAIYVLYRSIWKKRGHCCGCQDETCSARQFKDQRR